MNKELRAGTADENSTNDDNQHVSPACIKPNVSRSVLSLKEIYDEVISMSLPIKRDFTPEEFNSYIVVGFLPGAPIKIMVGRVVQVRNEAGAFGSNQIFMRCPDGDLQVHENQWFYKAPDKFIPRLNELFKDVPEDDKKNIYSIQGKYKQKGFIIKSKVKEGETTPMREVKTAIINKLSEMGF